MKSRTLNLVKEENHSNSSKQPRRFYYMELWRLAASVTSHLNVSGRASHIALESKTVAAAKTPAGQKMCNHYGNAAYVLTIVNFLMI